MRKSVDPISKVGFSQACERNKGVILEVLREAYADASTVVEIGSGTGQHAVHFARSLPHLRWQPCDRREYLAGLRSRLAVEAPHNIEPPLELDVRMDPWPVAGFDAAFSANTLHIMSWQCVERFFAGVGRILRAPGTLCVYGPFRYDGQFTSQSNAAFDQQLREFDPQSGIRDFEAVNLLAGAEGFELIRDVAMPANNRALVWGR